MANSGNPKSPRHNKLYRCPPTPSYEQLLAKEKSFILDCNAVHSISSDYFKANPKLGPVIPPYNGQRDAHTTTYFGFYGVPKTLKRTGQDKGGCSIEGNVMDRFFTVGAGAAYLGGRNMSGAGHSRETLDGHGQFLCDVRPIQGYHGPFGYRRNIPNLRHLPSPFGVGTVSPIFAEQLGPPDIVKCS